MHTGVDDRYTKHECTMDQEL